MPLKALPAKQQLPGRRLGKLSALLAVPVMGLAGIAALVLLPGVDNRRWLRALAKRLRL